MNRLTRRLMVIIAETTRPLMGLPRHFSRYPRVVQMQLKHRLPIVPIAIPRVSFLVARSLFLLDFSVPCHAARMHFGATGLNSVKAVNFFNGE